MKAQKHKSAKALTAIPLGDDDNYVGHDIGRLVISCGSFGPGRIAQKDKVITVCRSHYLSK